MQYKQLQYSPNFEKRILNFSKLTRNTVMNMIYEQKCVKNPYE